MPKKIYRMLMWIFYSFVITTMSKVMTIISKKIAIVFLGGTYILMQVPAISYGIILLWGCIVMYL